jgi:multicomponent Na+:H+ antiporter subunit E
MNMFLLNVLLAVTWGLATGLFTVPNLAFGFALGYLILRFSQRVLGPSPYFAKVSLALRFALRYLWELVIANFRVAYDVLVPGALPGPATGRHRAARPGLSPRAADPTGGLGPAFGDSLRAPITAESYVCPGVVGIPLDARTDVEIAVLANLITLTPGSVCLDLSEDRRVLYVHAMYIDGGDVEAYRRSVKEGLERRVLELLR